MLDRLTIGRMVAWSGDRPVLVALSGGGDSVALLHLLVAEFGASRLRAVIVDHALRAGAADDAKHAQSIAHSLAVPADILTLTWEEGANRAQQAAREARYRAICDQARALGLNTIATAHTADDQAETVLMRAANGSTWRGLAGAAPFSFAPLWPEGRGIALARPLLSARRERLRDHLRLVGAAWLEDPANRNPKFERVRVRQRLAELEQRGLDPMRFASLAARLRRRSDTLDSAASALIARATQLSLSIEIARAAWTGPNEVRQRALSALIAAASGASREPPWKQMAALEERVMHARQSFTHSGIEFIPNGAGIVLRREPGAVLGRADGAPALEPLWLTAEVEAIWDGRLGVTASEAGWRVVPARNGELVAFENGPARKRYRDVGDHLRLRSLAAARVMHAFAPDINRAKP